MNGEELPLNDASTKAAALVDQVASQDPSQDEITASLAAAQLPQAPLAMPKQALEHRKGLLLGRVMAMFGAEKRRTQG